MNENRNQKKSDKRRRIAILILLLAILLLLSMVALASRIGGFTWFKKNNEIPIPDDSVSSDVSGTGEDRKEEDEEAILIEQKSEIFRVSYTNGEAEVTVLSDDGDKLIAPGTSWESGFTLRNLRKKSVDYTLRMQSWVEGMEGVDGVLPVTARLNGPNGWVTDETGVFIPVLGLNETVDTGTLAAGNMAEYSFEWEWPFESGGEEADAFDTLLGNTVAFDHDIILYINLIVIAQDNTNPHAPGGVSPPTGDDFSAALWVTLMVISLFAFVFVLLRREDAAENTAGKR